MLALSPDKYQSLIINKALSMVDTPKNDQGIVVNAIAGSGKTNLLLMLVEAIKKKNVANFQTLITVFNKKNHAQLKNDVVESCGESWGNRVQTLSSLGYRLLREALGVYSSMFTIEHNKYKFIAQEKGWIYNPTTGAEGILGEAKDTLEILFTEIKNARVNAIELNLTSIKANLINTNSRFTDNLSKAVLDILQTGLEWGISKQIIDMEDMIWIPVISYQTDVRFRSAFISNSLQFIFNDEAQDTTLHQMLMLKYLRVDKGLVLACLDTNQICMTFRGCSLKPIELWQSCFNLEELSLNINYRCGKKHINLLNNSFGLKIEPAPGAKMGKIIFSDIDNIWRILKTNHKQMAAPALGIGRTHNLLLFIALKALENGIKTSINDNTFLDTLSNILRLTYKQRGNSFNEKLELYWLETVDKSRQQNQQVILGDIINSILLLYDKFKFNTLKEWQQFIKESFSMKDNSILILETIHKAKGSENPVVCYFEPEYTPMSGATEQTEENNLAYIALTRVKTAKRSDEGYLYLVKLNQNKSIPWIA